MKKIVSISEILKSATHEQVCASADAVYNEETGELTVDLKLAGAQPMAETCKTKVALEDADPIARDIFAFWIKRLVQQGVVSIQE